MNNKRKSQLKATLAKVLLTENKFRLVLLLWTKTTVSVTMVQMTIVTVMAVIPARVMKVITTRTTLVRVKLMICWTKL
jgi:hypothetical protein